MHATRTAFFALASLLGLAFGLRADEPQEPLRIAAAISLQDALQAVTKQLSVDFDLKTEYAFGSSGQLLGQIRQGAKFDIFIPAAKEQLDVLEREDLLVPGSRKAVAGNRLVLVVPAGAKEYPKSFEDLQQPAFHRLAIGEPQTVPAGMYAKQVLEKLGSWSPLQDRLVYGKNVRQVLDYVERGEVDAGVVYATDAKTAGEKVRVVATAEATWHEPIVYEAALLRKGELGDFAGGFIQYLRQQDAQKIFASFGFTPPADLKAGDSGLVPVDIPAPTPEASPTAP